MVSNFLLDNISLSLYRFHLNYPKIHVRLVDHELLINILGPGFAKSSVLRDLSFYGSTVDILNPPEMLQRSPLHSRAA